MSALHARCLCGAVAFDVHEPQALIECHCARCRRWTGSASVAVVMVAAADLEQTAGNGQLKRYEEDGFSDRYFCAECGSSLYSGGADARSTSPPAYWRRSRSRSRATSRSRTRPRGTRSAATRRSTRRCRRQPRERELLSPQERLL